MPTFAQSTTLQLDNGTKIPCTLRNGVSVLPLELRIPIKNQEATNELQKIQKQQGASKTDKFYITLGRFFPSSHEELRVILEICQSLLSESAGIYDNLSLDEKSAEQGSVPVTSTQLNEFLGKLNAQLEKKGIELVKDFHIFLTRQAGSSHEVKNETTQGDGQVQGDDQVQGSISQSLNEGELESVTIRCEKMELVRRDGEYSVQTLTAENIDFLSRPEPSAPFEQSDPYQHCPQPSAPRLSIQESESESASTFMQLLRSPCFEGAVGAVLVVLGIAAIAVGAFTGIGAPLIYGGVASLAVGSGLIVHSLFRDCRQQTRELPSESDTSRNFPVATLFKTL